MVVSVCMLLLVCVCFGCCLCVCGVVCVPVVALCMHGLCGVSSCGCCFMLLPVCAVECLCGYACWVCVLLVCVLLCVCVVRAVYVYVLLGLLNGFLLS